MEFDSIKIGVLMGGISSERDISLKSGETVFNALQSACPNLVAITIDTDNEVELKEQLAQSGIEVAFIALHGKLGEDGGIQKILEGLDIPYTGSGVEASRLAINKISCHHVFAKHDLPVPQFWVAAGAEELNTLDLQLPVMVKPATEGSSVGITLVKGIEDLLPAYKAASQYSSEVLIEQYISGREMTVGILDDQPLPVVEVRYKNEFYDKEAKYQDGFSEYLAPAPIEPELAQRMQEVASEAFRALGCRHFARIDFIMGQNGAPYILEVNTIPGFTPLSLLPMAAKVAGMDFTQLCLKLVELAYAEKKQKR